MGRLFEVPGQFVGQRIEVRYDEEAVYVYEDGLVVAKAIPVT